jgi:hypothetical protein
MARKSEARSSFLKQAHAWAAAKLTKKPGGWNLPSRRPTDHHINLPVPALRAYQPLTPIGYRHLGPVALGHLGGVGLNVMLARLAPYDKANMGSGGVPQCHGWAGIGFHLTALSPFLRGWLAAVFSD